MEDLATLVSTDNDSIVLQVQADGAVLKLAISLPPTSLAFLRQGKTTMFDLTALPVPLCIVLVGGEDTAALSQAMAALAPP